MRQGTQALTGSRNHALISASVLAGLTPLPFAAQLLPR